MELLETVIARNLEGCLKIHYMKKYILINSIILFIIISAFTACDSSQEKTEYHIRNNSNNKQLSKAIVPTNLFVREKLAPSISVLEARNRNIIGELLTVEGYIGSRKDPFSQNRASFILCDHTIDSCDRVLGDNCPTPWDACCEDRNKIINGTINIQVVDKNGTLVQGNLNGVGGLKPGAKIKVLGVVDDESITSSMVLNAKKIKIL